MKNLFLSIISLLALTTPVISSPLPDFPFTSVHGSASKKVAPDEATIEFEVLCYDPSSEVAVSSVNQILAKLVKDLLKLGVKEKDLVASDLSKQAVQERGQNYKQLKILGYNVSREVKVSLSEIKLYTTVMSKIMDTDQITKVSTVFDISKRDEIESALLSSACLEAKKKAELLSKGVGTQLGDVFAISSQNFANLSHRYGFGYSSEHYSQDLLPTIGGENNREVSIFVPAQIEIVASVNILYRLGSNKK